MSQHEHPYPTRSFFGHSATEALALAQTELGQDALVLGVVGRGGGVEVTACANFVSPARAASAPRPTHGSGSERARLLAALEREASEPPRQRRGRRRKRRLPAESGQERPQRRPRAEAQAPRAELDPELARELRDSGLSRRLCKLAARAAAAPAAPGASASRSRDRARAALCGRLERDVPPRVQQASQRVRLALVGSQGAGLSTVAAKLAARGARRGWNITVLAAGVSKARASALARRLNEFDVRVRRPLGGPALRRALDEARDDDLVVVDTPGIGADQRRDVRRLLTLLEDAPELRCQLVVSAKGDLLAQTRAARLLRAVDPRGLCLTHLDRPQRPGALLDLALALRLPLNWISRDGRIPGALELGSPGRLVERALGPILAKASDDVALATEAARIGRSARQRTRRAAQPSRLSEVVHA